MKSTTIALLMATMALYSSVTNAQNLPSPEPDIIPNPPAQQTDRHPITLLPLAPPPGTISAACTLVSSSTGADFDTDTQTSSNLTDSCNFDCNCVILNGAQIRNGPVSFNITVMSTQGVDCMDTNNGSHPYNNAISFAEQKCATSPGNILLLPGYDL